MEHLSVETVPQKQPCTSPLPVPSPNQHEDCRMQESRFWHRALSSAEAPAGIRSQPAPAGQSVPTCWFSQARHAGLFQLAAPPSGGGAASNGAWAEESWGAPSGLGATSLTSPSGAGAIAPPSGEPSTPPSSEFVLQKLP